jgi:hypothetical protein
MFLFLTGGHAITLSAEVCGTSIYFLVSFINTFPPLRSHQPNVNAVAAMAQCPYTGVSAPLSLGGYLKVAGPLVFDIVKQALGLTPVYIPIVAEPGYVGALTTEGSKSRMMMIVSKDQYALNLHFSSNTTDHLLGNTGMRCVSSQVQRISQQNYRSLLHRFFKFPPINRAQRQDRSTAHS